MNIIHFEMTAEDTELMKSIDSINAHAATVNYSDATLTPETTSSATAAEVITIFVNSVVDAKIIDALPNLKLLVTRSTGYDHIDVPYAQSKGITVCNIPGYGSRTVAEFTFALILNLSRKASLAAEQVKLRNNWDFSNFEGFDLFGKTLGVIGTGKIGLNVIKIAKGFGMNVLAHDAFPSDEKAKDFDFTYTSLSELLAKSDIVTTHVPGGKDTYHLINDANINQFKKGSLLINTSRGDVIDPEAILAGLNSGTLGGAALDVLEGEHELKEEAELMSGNKLTFEKLKLLLDDHMLIGHPNVIITPHIAFNTKEARQEIIDATVENIKGFIDQKLQNVIQIPHE